MPNSRLVCCQCWLFFVGRQVCWLVSTSGLFLLSSCKDESGWFPEVLARCRVGCRVAWFLSFAAAAEQPAGSLAAGQKSAAGCLEVRNDATGSWKKTIRCGFRRFLQPCDRRGVSEWGKKTWWPYRRPSWVEVPILLSADEELDVCFFLNLREERRKPMVISELVLAGAKNGLQCPGMR